jgi:DNA-binding transcriptional ArsR family regulator
LPRTADVRARARVFAALGDETRLRLVERLSERGPQSISELTEASQVTRQAVTKHLDVLGEAGIVHDAWDGRARVFELEPKRLRDARASLDAIGERWDDALDRLRRFVEKE